MNKAMQKKIADAVLSIRLPEREVYTPVDFSSATLAVLQKVSPELFSVVAFAVETHIKTLLADKGYRRQHKTTELKLRISDTWVPDNNRDEHFIPSEIIGERTKLDDDQTKEDN